MKILIIEDEKELAKSIGEYLSEEYYLCEIASTFTEEMNKIDVYTPADSPFYTSCGFDLIDNRNQRTAQFPDRPIDRVSGYTIKQLESSLYGATNWNTWRDNIKNQHTNTTSGNVDELFDNWN